MKRIYHLQPGPVGDEREAELHADTTRCPRCGGWLGANLPARPPMEFARRATRRCLTCEIAIRFDYLPGRMWSGKLLAPFELAASPHPSLVLTATELATRVNKAVTELDGLETRSLHAAADALEALWELEKLPDAPSSLRAPHATSLEQRLARTYLERGGRVPPQLRERFAQAQSGTRPPPPLTAAGWVLTWFADRKHFEAIAPGGLTGLDAEHVRLVVDQVLSTLQRWLDERREAAQALPRIDTAPPSAAVFSHALGVVQALEDLVREAQGDALERATKLKYDALDRGRSYFDLLARYQSALDACARAVAVANLDSSASEIAAHAWWGSIYELAVEAAATLPAWPLDGSNLMQTPVLEGVAEDLSRLRAAAGRSTEREPSRAITAALADAALRRS